MEGARIAAADGILVRVFGPASLIGSDGVEVVPTGGWIANDADPVAAVRSTPGASVVMAAADVAEGSSGALVSAGSTGATMTAALFALKRLHGVHRPALAAQVPIPGEDGTMLFLDVGANTEVRPQHLIQFAYLGSAFSQAVLGIERPRVALLVGRRGAEERQPGRGRGPRRARGGGHDRLHRQCRGPRPADRRGRRDRHRWLHRQRHPEDPRGDREGGRRGGPRRGALGPDLRRRRAAYAPGVGGLRRGLDPNAVGGAVLLGLRGVAVVAHGSSTPEGIANALRLADTAVRERAAERTAESLRASGATREALRETPTEGTR